jgi:hypothetical protein
MVLMAFFEMQPDLRDSDEERVEFTKYYLKNLRFLYKDSEHENKKVCDPERSHLVHVPNNTFQKWKGLLRSPFVLQTFAAHLAAIEGSVKISSLHDIDKPTPTMVGGLGLAAASVSTAHRACRAVLTTYRWRGH